MSRQEIFKLSKSRKFDLKGIGERFFSRGGKSPDCNDKFKISYSSLRPRISNIQYSHQGCILSRAAMNAIVESIQDKTPEEAIAIIGAFKEMVSGVYVSNLNLPERLTLFKKYSQFPSRRNCLTLGCDIILEAINSDA